MNKISILTFVNLVFVSVLIFLIIEISHLKFYIDFLQILQKDISGTLGVEKSTEGFNVEMNLVIFLVLLVVDLFLLSLSLVKKSQIIINKTRIQMYIMIIINFAIIIAQYNEVLYINSLSALFFLSSKSDVPVVMGKYDKVFVDHFVNVLLVFSLLIFIITLNYIFLKLRNNYFTENDGNRHFIYHIMILVIRIQFVYLFERLLNHAFDYQDFVNFKPYQDILNVILFFIILYIGWSSDYSANIDSISNKIYLRMKSKYSKFISLQFISQILNYATVLFAGLMIYQLSIPFEEFTISMKLSLFSVIQTTIIVWLGMLITTLHKKIGNSSNNKIKFWNFDISISNLIQSIKTLLKWIFICYLLISTILVSVILENQYTRSVGISEERISSASVFDVSLIEDKNLEGNLYFLSDLKFEGQINGNSEVRLSFTSIIFFQHDLQSGQINIEGCIDVIQVLSTTENTLVQANNNQFTLISTLNDINVLHFILNASAIEFSDFDIGLGNRITETNQDYCSLNALPLDIITALNEVFNK